MPMTHPISVTIYPLFGGWRAECRACGAYGNSEDNKYKSNISVALDNLSKNQYTYSEASKTCNHFYGNYKPRVNYYIDYNNLKYIKEPFIKKGCEKFPVITLDNKFDVNVFNAKNLTHEWSAYSYNRYTQTQELKHKEEEEKITNKEEEINQLITEAQSVPENKNITPGSYANVKTFSIVFTVLVLGALVLGEVSHYSKSFFLALLILQIINIVCRGLVEYIYDG